jgi:hypothetical protein
LVSTPSSTASIDRPSRGWRRMHEMRREDEAKRQRLVAGLLAELGRPAGAAETLAATVVRADRLRMAGRSDIRRRSR